MLSSKQRYLQIALNSNLFEARKIIQTIPLSKRVILEAGTPLIKEYGHEAIAFIKKEWNARFQSLNNNQRAFYSFNINPISLAINAVSFAKQRKNKSLSSFKNSSKKKNIQNVNQDFFEPYIVADLKCMDRGIREVRIASQYGASAATALGCAPIETLDSFIEECENLGIDAMIDMMNIDFPIQVLGKLKKQPRVVILHRGVDEERLNQDKKLPLDHIQRIKGTYNNILISIAGGDTIREVQRAVFNDCDIVVVWKNFYSSSQTTADLAQEFLKEIR